MNININSNLLNKTEKIITDAVKLYLEFWNIKSIEFGCSAAGAEAFEELCSKTVCEGERKLIITDEFREPDGGCIYSTYSQLIYDLDVFNTIPGEIYSVVNPVRFAEFSAKAFERMKSQGWDVAFSNRSMYTDLLEQYCPADFININAAPKSFKTFVINCWDEKLTKEYYDKYKADYMVETHRALALLREWLISEICFYFKDALGKKGVKLYLFNWEWAQNNYLFPKKNFTALEKEQRAQKSVYNIIGAEEEYADFLKEIYGKDYSADYVKNIMDIPLRNYYGIGSIHHADKKSPYLNVSLGERKTANCPEEYENTVYMLGGCVFFGYAIDDSNTIASWLQRKINAKCSKPVRVANYALWGGNIDETYNTFYELEYKRGDVVVISYAGKIPIDDYDISKSLSSCNTDKEFYFDGVVHCNSTGYKAVADSVYGFISDELNNHYESDGSFRLKRNETFIRRDKHYEQELEGYLDRIKDALPPLFEKNKTYGCAVMNCNPFTLGHRGLIEYAAGKVDYLIIFVVEENKSFFPFEDRIELVKKGVADLKNVYVVPSGNLIISTVTFPGYFLKDNPDKAVIDSSVDVEFFGQYIAPALGISKRFVGEEPTDFVTDNYNKTMQSILPRYGVQLDVIKRRQSESEVISASTVRKFLKEERFDRIKRFVPETTYSYLVKRFGSEAKE